MDGDNAPRPPKGVAALFSCSAGQRAFEHPKLEHGIFFHYVLEGLRGQAKNAKGQVTWTQLVDYVTQHVPAEVPKLIGGGAKQEPNLVANIAGQPPVLLSAGLFVPVVFDNLPGGIRELAFVAEGNRFVVATRGEEGALKPSLTVFDAKGRKQLARYNVQAPYI